MYEDCVFCKIINKEIDSKIVYEDEDCVVIPDINPVAELHLLVIPKAHYARFDDMTEMQAIAVGRVLRKLCSVLNLVDYRLVVNQGRGAGQTVFHLHMHILSGNITESDKSEEVLYPQ